MPIFWTVSCGLGRGFFVGACCVLCCAGVCTAVARWRAGEGGTTREPLVIITHSFVDAATDGPRFEDTFKCSSRCLFAELRGAREGSNEAALDGSNLRLVTWTLRLSSENRTTHQPGTCDSRTPRRAESLKRQTRAPTCLL